MTGLKESNQSHRSSGSNLTFESSPADEKQPRYYQCQDNLIHRQTSRGVRSVRFAPLGCRLYVSRLSGHWLDVRGLSLKFHNWRILDAQSPLKCVRSSPETGRFSRRSRTVFLDPQQTSCLNIKRPRETALCSRFRPRDQIAQHRVTVLFRRELRAHQNRVLVTSVADTGRRYGLEAAPCSRTETSPVARNRRYQAPPSKCRCQTASPQPYGNGNGFSVWDLTLINVLRWRNV